MPVTFRYGFTAGALTGFIHAVIVRRMKPLYFHTIIIGLGGGLGLCYHDFKAILENSQYCSNYEK
jgi:hypothetical protein